MGKKGRARGALEESEEMTDPGVVHRVMRKRTPRPASPELGFVPRTWVLHRQSCCREGSQGGDGQGKSVFMAALRMQVSCWREGGWRTPAPLGAQGGQ